MIFKKLKTLFLILIFIFLATNMIFCAKICWNCKKKNPDYKRYCIDCSTDISKVKPIEVRKTKPLSKNKIKIDFKNFLKPVYLIYLLGLIIAVKLMSQISSYLRKIKLNSSWKNSKQEYQDYKKRKEEVLAADEKENIELLKAFSNLGLNYTTSSDKIQKAYNNKLKDLHPDKHINSDSQSKLKAKKDLEKVQFAFNLIKKKYNM